MLARVVPQVAFLDNAETGKGPGQFSVMARGRDLDNLQQAEELQRQGISENKDGVVEVSRGEGQGGQGGACPAGCLLNRSVACT